MPSASYIHSISRRDSGKAIDAHDDKLTKEEVEDIVDYKIRDKVTQEEAEDIVDKKIVDKVTQDEVEDIVDYKIDGIDEILVSNRDSEVYLDFKAADEDNRPAIEFGSDGLPWFSTSYDSSVFFDHVECKSSVDIRDDLRVDGAINSGSNMETKKHVKARKGVWSSDGYYIKGKMVLNNQLDNVAKADSVNTEDILYLVDFVNNQFKKFNDLIDELVDKGLMKK